MKMNNEKSLVQISKIKKKISKTKFGNGFVQNKIYTYDYFKTNCDYDSYISLIYLLIYYLLYIIFIIIYYIIFIFINILFINILEYSFIISLKNYFIAYFM